MREPSRSRAKAGTCGQLGQGDYLGEIALVFGGTRTATATVERADVALRGRQGRLPRHAPATAADRGQDPDHCQRADALPLTRPTRCVGQRRFWHGLWTSIHVASGRPRSRRREDRRTRRGTRGPAHPGRAGEASATPQPTRPVAVRRIRCSTRLAKQRPMCAQRCEGANASTALAATGATTGERRNFRSFADVLSGDGPTWADIRSGCARGVLPSESWSGTALLPS